jgi:hypothetical protein
MAHRVADGSGDTLNRCDLLADGPTSRCLAGLLVLAVDQDGAGGTEARTAAELGPVQAEYVAQNPQQRRRFVPVIDLDIVAVHVQSHADEYQARANG